MRDMTRLLEESLDAGCFGLSSGLMYMPGTFADTSELVALARATRRHRNAFYARICGATAPPSWRRWRRRSRSGGRPTSRGKFSHLAPSA